MFRKNDNMGMWADWNVIYPDINFENITLFESWIKWKIPLLLNIKRPVAVPANINILVTISLNNCAFVKCIVERVSKRTGIVKEKLKKSKSKKWDTGGKERGRRRENNKTKDKRIIRYKEGRTTNHRHSHTWLESVYTCWTFPSFYLPVYIKTVSFSFFFISCYDVITHRFHQSWCMLRVVIGWKNTR